MLLGIGLGNGWLKLLGIVGGFIGLFEGEGVGFSVDGVALGYILGLSVVYSDGCDDSFIDGLKDEPRDGTVVTCAEGLDVGLIDARKLGS